LSTLHHRAAVVRLERPAMTTSVKQGRAEGQRVGDHDVLVIRDEQMSVLMPAAQAAFARRLAEYIREHHGESVAKIPSGVFLIKNLPDEVLLRMIGRGFRRARRYGMSTEASLA